MHKPNLHTLSRFLIVGASLAFISGINSAASDAWRQAEEPVGKGIEAQQDEQTTAISASLASYKPGLPSLAASFPGLVVPGTSIGPFGIGAKFKQLKDTYGLGVGSGFANLVIVQVPNQVELVFGSPTPNQASDEAVVVAMSTVEGGSYSGAAIPGKTRRQIESYWGAPKDVVGTMVFYSSGFGVVYDVANSQDAIAKKISVFASFAIESKAPEMTSSKGPYISTPSYVDTRKTTLVDAHLHPGKVGRMPSNSRQFLISKIPPFLQPYGDALLGQIPAPYAPYLGIKDQTKLAGANTHAVLLAVYAQKTTGFETNEDLEAALTDSRNKAPDGLPWAWGMASINWFDGYVDANGNLNKTLAAARLKALASYFERRRDLFIGIKLAHAHQGVAFDDIRYSGVYDVALQKNVPVYLHTGFSPFPGSMTDYKYYDPIYMETFIKQYPTVKFILGHCGQGDARAMEHALSMAQTYSNVYLEISALESPFFRDANGASIPPDFTKPQYPYVIQQVKLRGLINKTYYGSDGPQSSGFVASYTKKIMDSMTANGYTAEEVKKVMCGNFFDIFFPSSHL